MVEFTSTSFSAAEILDPNGTGAAPDMIFDSFGSGVPYGVFEVFDPNGPMPTLPDTYTIPLPGSIPDVEAAIGGGSIFVVTAKLATYDPGPIGPGPTPIVPYEYVFGLTDVVSSLPLTVAPELTITSVPIPEPASMSLLAIGLVCWNYSRRKV